MILDRKVFRSVPQLFRLWPSPSSRVVAVHIFKLPRFVMAGIAEQLSEELKHILAKSNVATEMQAHIAGLGLTTVSLFALIGDDRGAVRECLAAPPFDLNTNDTGISATVKLQRRIAQAQIVDAWEAARARTEQNRKVEAVQRASQLPITIASGTLVVIRRAYEAVYGKMEDEVFPADALIERRMQEVEQGSSKAELLSEVSNALAASAEAGVMVMNSDGSFRIKRATQKMPMPADPEQLRKRVKTLGVSYTIAGLQHPSLAWLKTATPDIWISHLDYVLGDKVWGFRTPATGEHTRCSWTVVLEYEQALRREAIKKVVYEGLDIKAALEAVRKDPELKETHFITKALFDMIAPPRNSTSTEHGQGPYGDYRLGRKERKGKGKGKNKGKDKGKTEGKGRKALHDKTPEGVEICFAFNKKDAGCKGFCRRAHVCRKCLGPHPWFLCQKGGDLKVE